MKPGHSLNDVVPLLSKQFVDQVVELILLIVTGALKTTVPGTSPLIAMLIPRANSCQHRNQRRQLHRLTERRQVYVVLVHHQIRRRIRPCGLLALPGAPVLGFTAVRSLASRSVRSPPAADSAAPSLSWADAVPSPRPTSAPTTTPARAKPARVKRNAIDVPRPHPKGTAAERPTLAAHVKPLQLAPLTDPSTAVRSARLRPRAPTHGIQRISDPSPIPCPKHQPTQIILALPTPRRAWPASCPPRRRSSVLSVVGPFCRTFSRMRLPGGAGAPSRPDRPANPLHQPDDDRPSRTRPSPSRKLSVHPRRDPPPVLAPDAILTQDLCDVCSIDLRTVERLAATMSPRPKVVSLNPQGIEGVLDDLLRVWASRGPRKPSPSRHGRSAGAIPPGGRLHQPLRRSDPRCLPRMDRPALCRGALDRADARVRRSLSSTEPDPHSGKRGGGRRPTGRPARRGQVLPRDPRPTS